MSDEKTEEIKRNILSPSQWFRILYMVFYAVACWVVLFVLPIIIVCQVLISLISGADNKNLRDFGSALSDYLHHAINYLLYVSDDKPWPFNETGNDDDAEPTSADPEPADPETADPETESAEVTPATEPEPGSVQTESTDDDFADISFTGDTDNEDQTAQTDVESDTEDNDTPKQ
jgi:hypothetical protein